MARYCDLDALIETFEERNRNTCNGSLTCLQLIRILKTTPVADVAPKSELAILSVQNAALEKAKFELQQELEACKGLKKILDTCAAELKKKYIGDQK